MKGISPGNFEEEPFSEFITYAFDLICELRARDNFYTRDFLPMLYLTKVKLDIDKLVFSDKLPGERDTLKQVKAQVKKELVATKLTNISSLFQEVIESKN
mmetsp:Transcript_19053/g.29226  ORF Transcript_19053/g.29226 Transcript_19053/m.29226 type:complete len:100 (+) Transcript_19053:815-1114(+)